MSSSFSNVDFSRLNGLDWTITVASLVVVFAIGLYSARSQRRRSTSTAPTVSVGLSASHPPPAHVNDDEEYFLAGRSTPWYIVAASLFASNIGSEHFVGQAGTACAVGLSTGLFEWTAAYFIIALGWIYAPVYLKARLTTVPEYLERRFSRNCRAMMVTITLASYSMAKIASSLYAGAVLLELLMGLGTWVSVPVIIVMTGLYTVSGGLHAVLWTDAAQMCIFLFGGIIGMAVAMHKVGGQAGMFRTLDGAGLPFMKHMIREPNDRSTPWPGLFFGQLVSATWYWTLDQEMAQRVLSAKGLVNAQRGAAAAALLKLFPVYLVAFPGMAARSLFESCRVSNGAVNPKWCATRLDVDVEANKAYPYLLILEFPNGVKGLMLASFLAAMMSSLSSIFNSASTLFTYDLYQHYVLKDQALTPERAVKVGRFATVFMVVLSLLWLPLMRAQNSQLYLISMNTLNHLTPAVVPVFFLGMLSTRITETGALAGMGSGFLLGIVRLITNMASADYCKAFGYTDPLHGKLLHYTGGNWFRCMHFSYFAFILASFTAMVTIVVSLAYPKTARDPREMRELTLWAGLGYAREAKQREKAEEKEEAATAAAGAMGGEPRTPLKEKVSEIQLSRLDQTGVRGDVEASAGAGAGPGSVLMDIEAPPKLSLVHHRGHLDQAEEDELPTSRGACSPSLEASGSLAFRDLDGEGNESRTLLAAHGGGPSEGGVTATAAKAALAQRLALLKGLELKGLSKVRRAYREHVASHPWYRKSADVLEFLGPENVCAVGVCILMASMIGAYW